jgi:hypothetical protein
VAAVSVVRWLRRCSSGLLTSAAPAAGGGAAHRGASTAGRVRGGATPARASGEGCPCAAVLRPGGLGRTRTTLLQQKLVWHLLCTAVPNLKPLAARLPSAASVRCWKLHFSATVLLIVAHAQCQVTRKAEETLQQAAFKFLGAN